MSSHPETPGPGVPEPEGFWKRHQRHMPRRLPRVLLAAGLLLVPAVVVVRIFTAKPVEETAPAAAPTDAVTLGAKSVSLAGIEVAEAKSVTRAATFDAPAVLALDEARTARIGSLVEGDVVRILSEVGSRVGRGAVLAELNSRVVHDAWADYRKAVADRRRRETELAWATQAAERAGAPSPGEGALAPGAAARRDRPGGRPGGAGPDEDGGAARRGGARAPRRHEQGGPDGRDAGSRSRSARRSPASSSRST